MAMVSLSEQMVREQLPKKFASETGSGLKLNRSTRTKCSVHYSAEIIAYLTVTLNLTQINSRDAFKLTFIFQVLLKWLRETMKPLRDKVQEPQRYFHLHLSSSVDLYRNVLYTRRINSNFARGDLSIS